MSLNLVCEECGQPRGMYVQIIYRPTTIRMWIHERHLIGMDEMDKSIAEYVVLDQDGKYYYIDSEWLQENCPRTYEAFQKAIKQS